MTNASLPWLAWGRVHQCEHSLLLTRSRVHQREDTLLLRAVVERTKSANLIEASHPIEGIEKIRVARGELGRLQITAPQIRRMERAGMLRGEKMKAQPAPIGS